MKAWDLLKVGGDERVGGQTGIDTRRQPTATGEDRINRW
jgi:hypothetical protein